MSTELCSLFVLSSEVAVVHYLALVSHHPLWQVQFHSYSGTSFNLLFIVVVFFLVGTCRMFIHVGLCKSLHTSLVAHQVTDTISTPPPLDGMLAHRMIALTESLMLVMLAGM